MYVSENVKGKGYYAIEAGCKKLKPPFLGDDVLFHMIECFSLQAFQNGVIIPPYKRLFTEWHKITNMKISLHSCGSIVDILPDLIECGLDIINPVQVSARGMDPEILKQKFGDQIIFYGGSFDAVSIPVSTPSERVYEQVKRNIEILSRGGGYIFAGIYK